MSLLNQLFNRGLLGAKCKTCLTLAISRIKLLQNKREGHLKQMRKEIAQFLQTGQEAIARIRVEHVIREQNIQAAYEILELFCEFVLARVPILESQKECPPELQEAIASIIFAAPRCSDLPDLLQIKNMFAAKYGKEFVLAASELRPDTSVNRAIIEKLSVSAPSAKAKLKLLKDIAREYNLGWDSSNTEAEFSKKHEDLLDGSRQICGKDAPSRAPTKQGSLAPSPSSGAHPKMSANSKQRNQSLQSPSAASNKSVSSPDIIEPLIESYDAGSVSDTKRETRSQSSDILERAQAAIAAAERASAAARAAAELVNVNFGSQKQEGKS
ncbi:hypothetical protein L1049_006439 [Liquidambar formosana]|uniref:IST1 homolog n=1 Tax=Liquidambar formosana TaxID=63359 RepID=A0AAP0RH05_LIQFO